MRRKADGTAFEKEFEKAISKKYYVRRLPTLNLGFAGMTQPADFMVVGKAFNYVELKETGADAFSFSNMEQMPEIEEFYNSRDFYRSKIAMEYLIVVHFVKHNVYAVLTGQQALHMRHLKKQLHYDQTLFLRFSSLEEVVNEVAF